MITEGVEMFFTIFLYCLANRHCNQASLNNIFFTYMQWKMQGGTIELIRKNFSKAKHQVDLTRYSPIFKKAGYSLSNFRPYLPLFDKELCI